ncbi:Hsp70-binding 1 [Chlorella sorokiniana]|uniref:Hsp70-binding 1 n=1 Tax=Chlorella sorokiniana TaxID=3076 RepID=A0A2P6TMB3_CHLSO|nr:Hsp70-binding 1 [Chlorella sorokiniana]|eukprot:PRW45487.1 Hsp70-binding 1 [Chlorella sorokiniana]
MEHVWKGLFDWSMQHREEGDGPPRPMSEADRHFLEDALKSAMIDLGQRMADIKESLDAGGAGAAAGDSGAAAAGEGSSSSASLEDKERLLDELLDIVEQIDLAKDLHTIGGLPTLLALLASPHPSLRWRAAEVAATCAQNNPPVQKAFFDGGIMPRLLPLLHDENATVQTKALLAISCMVRGYAPALVALRQANGVATLVGLLAQPEPRLQRKCLQVLQYMLRVMPLDRQPACADTNLLPALSDILGCEDNDMREAALAVAQQLAADDGSLRLMQQPACGFGAALQALLVRLDTLPQEEWGSVEDEAAAAKQLATALQRELPPAAATQDAAGPASPQAVGVVDDSSTSGAPAAALQLVAVPAAAAEPATE